MIVELIVLTLVDFMMEIVFNAMIILFWAIKILDLLEMLFVIEELSCHHARDYDECKINDPFFIGNSICDGDA